MEREEVPELNTFKNISLNEQYMILFESQNSQKKKTSQLEFPGKIQILTINNSN
jgi:hypothetical protein